MKPQKKKSSLNALVNNGVAIYSSSTWAKIKGGNGNAPAQGSSTDNPLYQASGESSNPLFG